MGSAFGKLRRKGSVEEYVDGLEKLPRFCEYRTGGILIDERPIAINTLNGLWD